MWQSTLAMKKEIKWSTEMKFTMRSDNNFRTKDEIQKFKSVF